MNRHLCRMSFIFLLLISFSSKAAEDLSLLPDPALSPVDVVNFQLHALRANNNGDGIEATFRFASPANKLTTGPLEKFSTLFDIEQYRPMLNHDSATIKLHSDNGHRAELVTGIVDSEGKLHWYRFILSRQQTAPFVNCWMTDAVMLEKPPEQSA